MMKSMIVQIGHVSHHLGPLLGAFELIALCDLFFILIPKNECDMYLDIKVGASMVKWTKKVLLYPKAIGFFGQTLKSSSKMLSNFFSFLFHGDLYCCVKCSNVE
jgi:hypothetical protein